MAEPTKRILLIHGAWAGAWIWNGVVDALHALGWQAEALDLPGDGFHPIGADTATEQDFYDCLATAINREPGPVVLAGHSGGGMLVTAAANAFPQKVSHGIWIAGFLIPDGRTYDEIRKQVPGVSELPGALDYVTYSDDGKTTAIAPDAGVELFLQDVPDKLAREIADKFTPQPVSGARLRTPTTAGFRSLPKLYFLTNQDQSIQPQVQRTMCRAMVNLTIQEIQSGHVPQLTKAQELAEQMDHWVKSRPSPALV